MNSSLPTRASMPPSPSSFELPARSAGRALCWSRSTDFLIEQGVAGQFNQMNVAMIGNKDVANLWRRGVESRRALDDDERVQFDFLVQSYMNIHHIVFDLGSKGFVDQRLFEATKMELAQYGDSQGFREALEGRAFWYSAEFGALLGLDRRAAKALGSD